MQTAKSTKSILSNAGIRKHVSQREERQQQQADLSYVAAKSRCYKKSLAYFMIL